MSKIIISTILSLLTLLLLTGCGAAGAGEPTPTIIPLDRSQLAEQVTPTTMVTETTTSLETTTSPTATPIPPPSPTPLLTIATTETLTSETVTAAGPSFTATPTMTSAVVEVEIVAPGLNIRQGPGINYETVTGGVQGDRFEVLGVDPTGYWLQVVTDKGPAWLSSQPQYSRLIEAEIEELPVIETAISGPTPEPTKSVSPASESNIKPTEPADNSAVTSPVNDLTGKLIFMTSSGGELYTVHVDGSNLKRIAGAERSPTTFMGGVIDPVVSPDGQQVAFTRWDGAEFGALFVVNVDGTGERLILNDIRQPKSPTWSPNGSQIMISFQHGGLRDPKEECRDFDLDDGIRLPDDIAEITKTRFGNDIEICFIRREDLQWALRRVDVATGEFEDMLSEQYSFTPTWHPDDPSQVIYKGRRNLVRLDLAANEPQPLFDDVRDRGPVFSPDGSRLALTYKQHDHWEVYVLDLATGQRQRLTKPPILATPQYNSAAPAWSPDGQHLAFVTDRTGEWEIWVMAADGRNQRPLLSPALQAQLALDYRGVDERMLNWVE